LIHFYKRDDDITEAIVTGPATMSMNCLAGSTPVRGLGSIMPGSPDRAEPDSDQYLFGQVLARPPTISSVVQVARHRRGGGDRQHVVIKRYQIDRGGGRGAAHAQKGDDEAAAGHILHEIASMKQLQHPNIQPCLTSFVVDSEVWLVQPLMAYGSAKDLVAEHFRDGLPETVCCFLLRDAVLALQYLHGQGIVHRSVRASHLLVSEAGAGVLTGFRYCTNLHSSGTGESRTNLYDYPLHGVTGNLHWLAPEILQQNLLGYNESSDMYSLAVTACEMANGLVPFSEMPPTLMLLEKLRGVTPKLMDVSTMSHPQDEDDLDELAGFSGHPADSGVGASVGSCNNVLNKDSVYHTRQFSGPFHQFVEDCSLLSPEDRPLPDKLLHHAFLKQLKKTSSPPAALLEPVRPLQPVLLEEDDDNDAIVLERMQTLAMDSDSQVDWDFD